MSSGPRRQYNNAVLRWIEYRLPIVSTVEATIGRDMPTPRNLNYWWSMGSILMLALVIQILTGIFLAMHYVPTAEGAFDSVERIMRDVNNGWLIRYMHANGASLFFAAVSFITWKYFLSPAINKGTIPKCGFFNHAVKYLFMFLLFSLISAATITCSIPNEPQIRA